MYVYNVPSGATVCTYKTIELIVQDYLFLACAMCIQCTCILHVPVLCTCILHVHVQCTCILHVPVQCTCIIHGQACLGYLSMCNVMYMHSPVVQGSVVQRVVIYTASVYILGLNITQWELNPGLLERFFCAH